MELVNYNDFMKLDLKVGEIINAEAIPGKNKLVKISVSLGIEERTLVAGILPAYSLEELVGKKIIVLVNLQPRVIAGIESQGMLLAALSNDKISLLTVDKEIDSGARIE